MKILSKTGKEACAIHFCGYSKKNLSSYLYRMSQQTVMKPSNATIITFAQEHLYYPLIEQLTKSGISYVNLAEDIIGWENTLKPSLILQSLEKVTTEYAVILDAADVVLTESFSDIVELYQTYGKDILFSGNSVQYPNVPLDSLTSRECWGTEKYINSGCIIGKKAALKTFFTAVVAGGNENNKWKSDQYMVRAVFDAYKDIAAIDYYSKCFQSVIGHFILPMDETSTNYIIE
mgnify:CR=1 FL=1